MRNKLNCLGVLILAVSCVIVLTIILVNLNKTIDSKVTIKYCKVDSIYRRLKYEFMPELITSYHTDCGLTFSSNKEYQIGDSLPIKIIIIKK